MREHCIVKVLAGSIADDMGIEAGDILLAVNDREIVDVFDFDFFCADEYVELLIRKPDGEEWLLEVDKEADEPIGLVFDEALMDSAHSCKNKCIFCFIDQNPPGMRPTIYFKDDDTRLSFLQGNYVTLTNLEDADVERIIRYRMEPINISVHTTDPKLRVFMLKNPRSGEVLKYLERLYEAEIKMNAQIVLCKGVNDGEALKKTISDLLRYAPVMQSVSVVPVGLSKYRKGLYPLEPFDKNDACCVIDIIEEFQRKAYKEAGLHFVHASDEWYIMAGRDFPEEERYDGYLQLENGVGMMRLLYEEFCEALSEKWAREYKAGERCVSIACGRSAEGMLKELAGLAMSRYAGLLVRVYAIRNDFFGESVTVSGLVTAQDIKAQLADKELGSELLIPNNMLRAGTEIFLDDGTVSEVSQALQKPVTIVKSSGGSLLGAMLGLKRQDDGAELKPYELQTGEGSL